MKKDEFFKERIQIPKIYELLIAIQTRLDKILLTVT